HLEELQRGMIDPAIMKKYVGLDKAIEAEMFDDETEHYMLEQSRVSTFSTFLDMFPWTHDDVQMKRYALEILKEKLTDWKTGNIPVEGHYRYMMQDPYAVLEAGTKYEVRNDKGELLVVNRGDYHIQPNVAVVASASEDKLPLYVAAARNPMISKGEWQALRNKITPMYKRAMKKGAFKNMAIYSVHDFTLFAQGGADVDGDQTLTVTEEVVVKSILSKNPSPVMDIHFKEENGSIEIVGDGCPYAMDMVGVYRLPKQLVQSQNNYRVTFSAKQDNDELY